MDECADATLPSRADRASRAFCVVCDSLASPVAHSDSDRLEMGVGVLGAIDVAACLGWLCIRLSPLSHTPVPTATIGLPPCHPRGDYRGREMG